MHEPTDIYLSPQERLDLKKLLNTHACDDNTAHIRQVKHSERIQQDIMTLVEFMQAHPGTSDDDADAAAAAAATVPFLYANYTDIFRRVLRGEINYTLLAKVLHVLKAIEDEKVDQHEGSVLVGKVLKEFYLDSAVRHGQNLDKKYAANETPKSEVVPEKKISWKEFKQSGSVTAADATTTATAT